jgi:hypothetical protein
VGGAAAGTTRVDYLDPRAAPGAFEGHGAADDTGSDDKNAHEAILVGR